MVNKDTFEGNWNQFKGKVKEKWGKLTDDDITTIRGKRDQLLGKLQERYGYQREQAEQELETFERESVKAGAGVGNNNPRTQGNQQPNRGNQQGNQNTKNPR